MSSSSLNADLAVEYLEIFLSGECVLLFLGSSASICLVFNLSSNFSMYKLEGEIFCSDCCCSFLPLFDCLSFKCKHLSISSLLLNNEALILKSSSF